MKVYVETIKFSRGDTDGIYRECHVFISKVDAMADIKGVVKHYCRGDYQTMEYESRIAGIDSIYRLYMRRQDESLEIEIFEKEL